MNQNTKKIALVADWITHWGGAERVFAKLMEMYPEADIYTSVFFPDRPEVFAGRKVFTSFIQYIPWLNKRHKLCMLLRPFAFSRFDFRKYDLVISSSSAEAKGISIKHKAQSTKHKEGNSIKNLSLNIAHGKIERGPIHICYCHTPTRYLWSHSEEYKSFLEFGALNWLAKLVIPFAFRIMKGWDYRAAQRPTQFVANSRTTQKRIQEFYKRESKVVYPFFSSKNKEEIKKKKDGFIKKSDNALPPEKGGENKEGNMGGLAMGGRGDFPIIDSTSRPSKMDLAGMTGYFVCLGRIVPYKRFDLAIEACNELGLNLKIFTNTKNSESERLQKLSGPTIEWVFGASDSEVAEGLAGAKAFIMPQEEDFGIVSLEAMSHGTPVIAFGKGGATETVVDGLTGILFPLQTKNSLIEAIQASQKTSWNEDTIIHQSTLFSEERFEREFSEIVNSTLAMNNE